MSETAVDLSGASDWSPLNMPFSDTHGPSYVGDRDFGDQLRVKTFVRGEDRRLFARVWFGPGAQGPPGHAHGGSMAAVLDHMMGISCWVAGHPVVAATITVNFHRKLPLKLVTTVEAWVTEVQGKKISSVGRIYGEDRGTPFVSSDGLFIEQAPEVFKGFIDEEMRRERDLDSSA